MAGQGPPYPVSTARAFHHRMHAATVTVATGARVRSTAGQGPPYACAERFDGPQTTTPGTGPGVGAARSGFNQKVKRGPKKYCSAPSPNLASATRPQLGLKLY
jgi:hypothetical protein